MRTYTATATATAAPEAILDVLTDPGACRRWAPVSFDVDELSAPRLTVGSTARVSGRLAGREVGFDLEVHRADAERLALSADGPVSLDVAYELRPSRQGSEVHASVALRPRAGLRGRLIAEATAAVLAGGALHVALGRVVAEAALA
jgi:hypothetical protein